MTRKEAVERGSKTFHGQVCKRHEELGGLRRTKNRNCVQCRRDYNRLRARRVAKEKATDAIARASG